MTDDVVTGAVVQCGSVAGDEVASGAVVGGVR